MAPKISKIVLNIFILTGVILFFPGIPPLVKFEAFEVTPPMKLEGLLAPNGKLSKAEFLYGGKLPGADSVAVKDGIIYTGLIGGNVVKIDKGVLSVIARFGEPSEGNWEESKCGRPLGIRFDPNGKLVVNDAYYGIYRVELATGNVEQLISSKDPVDGKLLHLVNDLDITHDGTIYFTDSSQFSLQNSLLEFLGEPTGRLLKFDPRVRTTTVLLENLHFANGLQLSRDEEFVLVSETARFRIIKYHLKGEKVGTSEIFIDELPGYPDNIRSDNMGGFLVSLIAGRTAENPGIIDKLCKYPRVRKFVCRITSIIHTVVASIHSVIPNEYTGKAMYNINHIEPLVTTFHKLRSANIIQIDEFGKIKTTAQDSSGKVIFISEASIDDTGKYAYLGSPHNNGVWRVKVSDMGLKS